MKGKIKMRKIINKIILMAVIMLMILSTTGTVRAGFQANKETESKTNLSPNEFFEGIRLMESALGTLGKASNIDTVSGTYKDSSNNGIDCHMAKNTEWGTAAMLAASIYGEAPTESLDSITGNATGVYHMLIRSEFVAGIYNVSKSNMDKIYGADARYKDVYESATSKPGDATTETENWFKSSHSFPRFPTSDMPITSRGGLGLFGYSLEWGNKGDNCYSRAVVVCGTGL